jgi:hypothetical protein
MELDLQSLFGLHVHSCTHWLRTRNPPFPIPPHLGSHTRALLVSQDRRHLFVTPGPCCQRMDLTKKYLIFTKGNVSQFLTDKDQVSV